MHSSSPRTCTFAEQASKDVVHSPHDPRSWALESLVQYLDALISANDGAFGRFRMTRPVGL